MKIIHIVPGSGGAFYCENCLRDSTLMQALRHEGLDTAMVPLYLPLFADQPAGVGPGGPPVFFGAVNLYLRERLPLFRRSPPWLVRLLDSPAVLAWAARRAGSTRARGLEDMTLSMLRGEHGRQAAELEQLIAWLRAEGRPDVVHLSNALLIGMARRIREALNVPVVCTLQDEDTWLDAMAPRDAALAWQTMSERAADVDLFVGVSRFYGERMQARLGFPPERLRTVHLGIDPAGYERSALPADPPVIGYLSRLSEGLGLGTLADAFLALRQRPGLERARLRVTGGHTGADRAFLRSLRRRLAAAGAEADVDFVPGFDPAGRVEFLKSLTVMSVPMPAGEAFGVYVIEALAAGVPVVQPRVGAFPELVERTGGGVLYEPNTPQALADALESLLRDRGTLQALAARGRAAVGQLFTLERMARNLAGVYAEVVARRKDARGSPGENGPRPK